jgi:hypothetical protein
MTRLSGCQGTTGLSHLPLSHVNSSRSIAEISPLVAGADTGCIAVISLAESVVPVDGGVNEKNQQNFHRHGPPFGFRGSPIVDPVYRDISAGSVF